jgi:NAD(P)-dependent dehydrogenase (short-subunit alcohol dehydrogenase family)
VRGIAGKRALVTGGTSGIGLACVQALLDEGADVVAVTDSAAQLEAMPAADRLTVLRCDLADRADIASLAAQLDADGGIDILVNNAGIWSQSTPGELPLETWDRTLAVNVTAPFLLARALAPGMRDRGGGAIVNTASTNGLVAEPGLAHYNMSKGALVMLTRSLALDFAAWRIRVNAVAPGTIRTPLIAHLIDDPNVSLFGAIPWGRVGTPEEIADAIVFLASDHASYITGEILVVDGGQLALNGQMD